MLWGHPSQSRASGACHSCPLLRFSRSHGCVPSTSYLSFKNKAGGEAIFHIFQTTPGFTLLQTPPLSPTNPAPPSDKQAQNWPC